MKVNGKVNGNGRKKRFLIGTEIETCLDERKRCEDCDRCAVCDDCPPCYFCEYERNFCEYCEDEDPDCNVCLDRRLYRDFICNYCEPCSYCDYAYNPDNCPYENSDCFDTDSLPPELRKHFMDIYLDGSCGLEFCTIPFSDLKKYYNCLREFIEFIERESLSVYERCGGHINISYPSWKMFKKQIFHNVRYFLDVLTYVFLHKDTYRRESYHYWADYFSDCHQKFCVIHFKDYAVEYRFPDTPYDALNHTLLSAVLISLSTLKKKIRYDLDIYETKELYKRFKNSEFHLKDHEYLFISEKFKKLIDVTKYDLKLFSKQLKINLLKALKFRFENPAHLGVLLDEYEEDFKL